MNLLKFTTALAADMADLTELIVARLESPGRKFTPDEALGAQAEVSVAVGPGRTGEVVLVQAEALRHYPAQAKKPEQEFKRGAKVRIVDVGMNVMYIESFESDNDSNEQNSKPCEVWP